MSLRRPLTFFRDSAPTFHRKAQQEAPDVSPDRGATSDPSAIVDAPLLKASGPRGTVVVADDEPAICAMVAMVLAKADYHVIQAHHGRDAAYHIHTHGGQIEVLITDVMMPVVSGPELAAWVRRVWPHIPILFMSGFYEPSRLQLSADDLAHHFLAKPFSLSALTTHVSRLIADTRNDADPISHDSSSDERSLHGHTHVRHHN